MNSIKNVNPFQKQGVSKYPLLGNMVGQDLIYTRLEGFKEISTNSTDCAFYTIFGDWGAGKTRIAHELIAERTGNSKTWLIADKEGKFNQKKILNQESTIIPLFIKFEEVFEFRPISVDNIFPKLIYTAFHNLINKDSKIQVDLRDVLRNINSDYCTKIEDYLGDYKNDLKQFLSLIREEIIKKSNSKLIKFWIVIDEVEDIGETAGTPVEGIKKSFYYERGDLSNLIEAIKDEVNRPLDQNIHAVLDNFDFLFLCSEALESLFKEIGALERRYGEVKIRKSSKRDFLEFLRYLKNEGYPNLDFPGKVIESAIIAVDRNFGWFNYYMNSIYLKKKRDPNLKDYELLERAGRSLGKLFNFQMIQNIIDDDQKPNLENLEEILFKQIPISLEEMNLENDKIIQLLGYKDPNNISVFKKFIPIKIKKTDFQRIITTEKNFEYMKVKGKEESTFLKKGEDIFDNEYLFSQLKIFSTGDEDNFLIYSDFDAFKLYMNFLSSRSLTEETVKTFYDIFKSHQDQNFNEFIGISMDFLTKFNLRWEEISFSRNWLNSIKLELIVKQLNSETQGKLDIERRICEGIGKARIYQKYGEQGYSYNSSNIRDFRSSHIVIDILPTDEGENLSLLPVNKLLILYYRNVETLIHDFNELLNDPMICYLILPDKQTEEDYKSVIEKVPKVEKYIIPKLVVFNQNEHNFYHQFSFLDDLFKFKDIENRKYIENIWEKFKQVESKWLNKIDNEGFLIKPLFNSSLKTTPNKIFREILTLILEGYNYSDFSDPNKVSDNETLKKYMKFFDSLKSYLKQNENCLKLFNIGNPEDLETIDLKSNIILPRSLITLLKMIKTKVDPHKLNKEFFFDSKQFKSSMKNVQNVITQLIDILKVFGLIIEEPNKKLTIVDKRYLIEQYKLSQNKLALWLDESKDNSIKKLEDFYKKLPSYFKVDHDELERYLNEINNSSKNLDDINFNTFFSDEIEFTKFLQISTQIKTALNLSYKILKETESINIDKIPDVGGDMNLLLFSAKERIDFLIKTKEEINETIHLIQEKISTIEQEIQIKYSQCAGKPFITKPMEKILNNLKDDLAWKEDIRFSEELEKIGSGASETNNRPLITLIKSSLIQEIYTKLESYDSYLNSSPNSIWNRFISIHEKWEGILNGKLNFEDIWNKTEKYYEGSPEERGPNVWHEGKLSKKETAFSYLNDFKRTAEAEVGEDLNILEDLIDTIETNINELIELAEKKYLEGQDEIKDETSTTDLKIIQNLELRKEGNVTTDSTEIFKLTKHIDQHEAIEKLINTINQRAEELCVNNRLWLLYKKVTELIDIGESDDNVASEIGEDKLEELKNAGVLEYEKQVNIKYTIDL